MNRQQSNPPRLAIWLLRRARPGNDSDALTGDLLERFNEGQTRHWLWRQVFIALAVRVLSVIHRHWPYFCYAIVGTVIPLFPWPEVRRAPFLLHWWLLPWPWSQVIFDLSATILLFLPALLTLATGLVINREFRWASLFRTGAINLVFILVRHYLFDVFSPWLTRPVPGEPYSRVIVFPGILQLLFVFASLLVAAWLGCRSPRPNAASLVKLRQ